MRRKIDGGASVFLDSIRILSAIIVLVYHAIMQWLTNYPTITRQLGNLSHAAVVVFFVLSGYLIAYTTTSNNRGPRQYAIARLSRLYSVVIPAIFLTAVIEITVRVIDPALAIHYSRGAALPRYILSAFFCGEIGLLSASPPINVPLWSLSFEFWFYIIFGLWFYRGSNWKSKVLLIITCFIAGPKILLLMPIWILGLLAYRLPKLELMGGEPWLFVAGFSFTAVLIIVYLPEFPYIFGQRPLFYANRFVTDWAVGIAVSLTVWSLPIENQPFKLKWVKLLRRVADLSFPLYILHYPLLILWRASFGWQANNVLEMCNAIFFVSLISLLIGVILERQRIIWITFFQWGFNCVKPFSKDINDRS